MLGEHLGDVQIGKKCLSESTFATPSKVKPEDVERVTNDLSVYHAGPKLEVEAAEDRDVEMEDDGYDDDEEEE